MKFLNLIFFTVVAFNAAHSKVVFNENKEYINDIEDYIASLDNDGSGFNNLFGYISDAINSISDKYESLVNTVTKNYDPDEEELKYMESTEKVTVTEYKSYYLFDGPGNDKALIFYQGAKVDEKAYADIMFKLAENGIDCFLVKMPLRLAIFGINKASEVMKDYKGSYDEWYIGGHSLGGAMASFYTANHGKNIKGLVLLAAYSTKKIPEDTKVMTFIASNDKVMNLNKYNKYTSNLPRDFTEIKIEGGNHGQFGNYGEQSGDGKATISVEKQHKIIVDSIVKKFL